MTMKCLISTVEYILITIAIFLLVIGYGFICLAGINFDLLDYIDNCMENKE